MSFVANNFEIIYVGVRSLLAIWQQSLFDFLVSFGESFDRLV